jgi:aryl-alcohol dehydrogenase-like predicted oxidoreductase
MISLEDCIALCGLTEEQVLAIAEHEHVPEIVATSIAHQLLTKKHGPTRVRDMIRDDIRDAIARKDFEHARELLAALRHFLREHPEARGVSRS